MDFNGPTQTKVTETNQGENKKNISSVFMDNNITYDIHKRLVKCAVCRIWRHLAVWPKIQFQYL